MPEAVFVCLDSSDFMRNGDYFPNRMSAAQEAVTLLLSAKMQKNPENTVGFLTLGGKACTVMESLTSEIDSVMATVTRVQPEGVCHFIHGLQIASLALSHRSNPRAEKRIVAFVSSPITENEKVMEKLAKKLRKDEVAVDIVAFGPPTNNPLLEKFVETVSKSNNSHFVYVPEGTSICDTVLSSAVIYGDEAPPAGAGGAPGSGFEFGVDPSLDPELAHVLRLSLEEARRAQEGQNAPAAAATATEPAPAPEHVLTEEEELERALQMSLQESQAQGQPQAPAPAPKPSDGHPEPDPDFLAELEKEVEGALNKKKDEKK
jgi:26S proteasome regulatory subunit N10